ncbi:MAG: hypothetical protein EA404_13685 [Spirochaetaceae bacterium]|nr:MAG: hypothetical protein EA404_13685 [Spirochaetaceae bacterium]
MVVESCTLRVRVLLCLLPLLLSAVLLPARGQQQQGDAVQPAAPPEVGTFRVPLLFVFSYSGEQADQQAGDAVRASAAAALAERAPSLRLLMDDAVPAQARRAAIARDALGWVEVAVVEDRNQTRISIAGYAVISAAPVFEHSYSEAPGLTGPRLQRAWQPAAAEFERAYQQLVTAALADVRFTLLTLQAVPGTRISGLAEGAPLVVPDSGVLQLHVAAPLVYTIDARAAEHYPLQLSVLVDQEQTKLVLDQRPRSAYSWDLGLTNASYPSVEVSRRLAGDYLFVRGGFTTYLVGVAPLADNDGQARDEEDKLFYSEDMTVVGLQLGTYLHPPYGRLRGYLATGALWRQIHTRGYWGGDPVASWGLISTLGVENRPSRRWRLFFEWQPALYLSDYPEILMQQLPAATHLRGERRRANDDFLLTDETARSWVLSPLSFRLGVRWQP